MSSLTGIGSGPLGAPKGPEDAARELQATLVRQLLTASGAFKGSDVPGAQLHADMFVEVLADAIAKSDGFHLTDLIAQGLPDQEEPAGKPPGAPGGTATDLTAAPPSQVSGSFGERTDPIDGTRRFHTGMDLRAAEGTDIKAVASGVVVRAGARGGYGNAVEIDHGNGVSTLYAHASALSVHEGDNVQAGQTVAAVGQTGRATGPHLHFEVRVDGAPRNPMRALNAYGIRAESPIGENIWGHRERGLKP